MRKPLKTLLPFLIGLGVGAVAAKALGQVVLDEAGYYIAGAALLLAATGYLIVVALRKRKATRT